MIYYDKIDLKEGINVSKSNNSKEFIGCCCWRVTCLMIVGMYNTEKIHIKNRV